MHILREHYYSSLGFTPNNVDLGKTWYIIRQSIKPLFTAPHKLCIHQNDMRSDMQQTEYVYFIARLKKVEGNFPSSSCNAVVPFLYSLRLALFLCCRWQTTYRGLLSNSNNVWLILNEMFIRSSSRKILYTSFHFIERLGEPDMLA